LLCFLYLLGKKMPVEKHPEFGALQGSEPNIEQSGRTASRSGVDRLPPKEQMNPFRIAPCPCPDLVF